VFRGGSFRIARVNGISIEIHFTFLFAIVWGAWQGWAIYHDLIGVGFGILTTILLFGCIFLHELAHAWQAKAFGYNVRKITLLPIGGLADIPPSTPLQELTIAIAGPAINLVLAMIFAGVSLSLNVLDARQWLDAMLLMTPTFSGIVLYLLAVNLSIFVFNMLPAFPMDGGRVLRSMLALITNYLIATRISAWLGRLMAVAMIVAGALGWRYESAAFSPLLIVIGFVVYFGAQEEEIGVRRQWALAHLEVKDVYQEKSETVPPWETLTMPLIARLFKREQPLPVVLDGRVVGMLTYHEARRHLNPSSEITVAHAMRVDFPVLALRDTLLVALKDMGSHNLALLPVVQDDQYCGAISLEDIEQAWRFVTGL
jgi:Zn-dependent protease/predicted transcriptional regulator